MQGVGWVGMHKTVLQVAMQNLQAEGSRRCPPDMLLQAAGQRQPAGQGSLTMHAAGSSSAQARTRQGVPN